MPARRHDPHLARRSLAIAVIAAMVLTGCTVTVSGRGSALSPTPRPTSGTPRAPSSASPTAHPATFTDCRKLFDLNAVSFPAGRERRLSFSCARLSVPLDYRNPSGRSITLALAKVHDSANATGNTLVFNPGGPGASGIDRVAGVASEVSDALLSHFDLLAFDPRGVGLSSPISCTSDSMKDTLDAATPDVLTAPGFAQAKRLAQDVATSCNAKYGPSLADFDTVQTARDLDRIREAVSSKQLNYLGFSYGTELGSVYAHLFPRDVGVAVLDGAVDPLTDDLTSSAEQLKGFEDAFDQFAAYCVTHSPCKSLGGPRQVVYALVRQARAAPIKSSVRTESRSATASIVLTGVLYALYSQAVWAFLGQALIDARRGDAKGLFLLADAYNERDADGHHTNLADAFRAISCNDSKPGPSDATIRATAAGWARAYPMFGLVSAPSLFSCQVWQSDRTPVPLPSAATPRKVLVVGNLHDPATPYQGAKDLARTMGNAALLTWDGEGHTSYLGGSSCVDHYVDNYLITGAVPPPNTICPR